MQGYGHKHDVTLKAAIGNIQFMSIDLGSGPIEMFGRIYYKADGNNGTINIMDKFLRMMDGLTTGGQDNAYLKNHNHTPSVGDNFWVKVSSGAGYDVDNSNIDTYVAATTSTEGDGDGINGNMPAYKGLIPYEAVS